MAIIPELIYSMYGSNKQGVIPRPVFQKGTSSDTITSWYQEAMTVPDEFDMILTSMCAWGAGGAGVHIDTLTCTVGPPDANNIHLAAEEYATSSNDMYLFWSGQVWVMSGATLKSFGVFSAGGVTNQLTCFVSGILIPRLDV